MMNRIVLKCVHCSYLSVFIEGCLSFCDRFICLVVEGNKICLDIFGCIHVKLICRLGLFFLSKLHLFNEADHLLQHGVTWIWQIMLDRGLLMKINDDCVVSRAVWGITPKEYSFLSKDS